MSSNEAVREGAASPQTPPRWRILNRLWASLKTMSGGASRRLVLNGLDANLMRDIGVPDELIHRELARRRDPVRDMLWQYTAGHFPADRPRRARDIR